MRRLRTLVRVAFVLSSLFVVFLLTPTQASAKVVSYKVTDGFTVTPSGPFGVGRVFFSKFVGIPFIRGQILLSSTPDGTGSASIGDMVQVYATYPGSGIYTYRAKPNCVTGSSILPPTDITNLFFKTSNNFPTNNITVRFSEWCGGGPKVISPIYIVNLDEDPPPAPFLDLPYDYKSLGKTFEQVAYDPYSWFDHEYPLQNFCCKPPVLNFTGKEIDDNYRSHSGYDYSAKNGVRLNTPVLAAASGWATVKYASQSAGAGNIIKIDHGNGYQIWYEHLANDDLIVATPGAKVFVNKGDQIGKVGMTGNTTGPHIHLSVFRDANANGTFDDDYPWGLVDPLGWDGSYPDPWTEWESDGRNGAKSYKLFVDRKEPKFAQITTTGGFIPFDKVNISIPSGSFDQELTVKADYGPFESASATILSVVPSVYLNAFAITGEKVSQFLQPITLTYNYGDADLLNILEDSLQFYWFDEQSGEWTSMPSVLDKQNKTISTQTTHFSQFSVMGQVKDLIAPKTEVTVSGDKGQDNWYQSDVTVALNGQDNNGGVGLQYTLYTLNDEDWHEYTTPLVFSSEGVHTIAYQSFDNADNREERKTISFSIDKTPPEAKIFVDQDQQDIVVVGIDEHLDKVVKDTSSYTVSDLAGNTLRLDVRDWDKTKRDSFSIYSLQYNQDDIVPLSKNQYKVFYKGTLEDPYIANQDFMMDDEIKISIRYEAKKNQSTIITRELGQDKIIGVKDGIVLLQLSTDKDTLDYSY